VSPAERLAEHLLRAFHVFVLALAPTSFSPEPRPPERGALLPWLITTTLLLALALYAVVRLALRTRSRAARAAAALMWIAVAAALFVALVYSGDQAPLLRGFPIVAVPLWASGAAAAAALAGRRSAGLGIAAAAVVLAAGGVQLTRGLQLLASPERMWWTALHLDPEHDRAASELILPLLRAHRLDDARKVAERCLSLHPDGCACLDLRTRVAIAAQRTVAAVADARQATDRCPITGPSRALLAVALTQGGEAVEAEQQARLGLTLGGPPDALRYGLALALERQGRFPEATAEVDAAIAAGAGRDARLLRAALAIVSGDLDGARRALEPLVAADGDDADARYDLGLVAEKRGELVAAREAYQAALRADPRHENARFNVALIAWRLGSRDESQYHLARFRELFPDDPLGAKLATTLAMPSPPR
jgi:tetratricopeptide (TPR) repeat protein